MNKCIPHDIQLYILELTFGSHIKKTIKQVHKTINILKYTNKQRYKWYSNNKHKIILLLATSYPYIYNHNSLYYSHDIRISKYPNNYKLYKTIQYIPIYKYHVDTITILGLLSKCILINGTDKITKIKEEWDEYSNLLYKWKNIKIEKPNIGDDIYLQFKYTIPYFKYYGKNNKLEKEIIHYDKINFRFTKNIYSILKTYFNWFLIKQIKDNIRWTYKEYNHEIVTYISPTVFYFNKVLQSINQNPIKIPKIGEQRKIY